MTRTRTYESHEQRRTYMRQRRQAARALAGPTSRERILAAFARHGVLTLKQLLCCLGEGHERPAVSYHVRRLVEAGMLTVHRDQGRTGDGSWFRYILAASASGAIHE